MNRCINISVAVFGLIFVWGCATPYQSTGFKGGYSETWYSEREAEIRFSGNGFTSSERSANYAAFRACELALEKGFSHFIVLNSDESVSEYTSQLTPDRTDIRRNGYGGYTATTREGSDIRYFKPSNRLRVFYINQEDLELAYEHGLRPVDAKWFVENNAPEKVIEKIITDN